MIDKTALHNFNGLPTSGPELTDEVKAKIDAASYRALYHAWMDAPIGYFRIDSPVSKYYRERMSELKNANPGAAVQASKDLMRGGE